MDSIAYSCLNLTNTGKELGQGIPTPGATFTSMG